MDRRTFVKTLGALVPGVAGAAEFNGHVPCPPDPPGDPRSPARLLEALSGEGRGLNYCLGQELGREDLGIDVGLVARRVTYDLYYIDVSDGAPGVLVLIGPAERVPVDAGDGLYYAALQMPRDEGAVGSYLVRWNVDWPDFNDCPATRTVRGTVDTKFRVVRHLIR